MLELRDPVSSISHLATAVWAVFATLLMLRLSPRAPGRRAALLVYGLSMVLLFLASGTFHGLNFTSPERFRFYQKLDQSAVYLLIAGTNTPFMATLLAGRWRKRFLLMVWAIAGAGIASLWLLPTVPHPMVVGFYLSLGWLGIVPFYHYYRAVGGRAMLWIWLGAALYSLGAICELTRWPVIIPGWVQSHEVLHLCDSAANLAFFIFVFRYILPYPMTSQRTPTVAREEGAKAAASTIPASAEAAIFGRGARSSVA